MTDGKAAGAPHHRLTESAIVWSCGQVLAWLIQPLRSTHFEYQIKNADTTSDIKKAKKITKGLKLFVERRMPNPWINMTIMPSSDAINK